MSFNNDPALLANQLPISIEVPRLNDHMSQVNDSLDNPDIEGWSNILTEQLELYLKRIASAVNTKTGGLYVTIETAAFEQWFTSGNPQTLRPAYRKVFDIGAIAAGATSTTAHGITQETIFTHIYGTCITDVIDYRPIPYVTFNGAGQISLTVTPTDIVIVNGSVDNITDCYIVLEYLKT